MLNYFSLISVLSVLLFSVCFNDVTLANYQKRNAMDENNEYIDKLLDDTIEANIDKLEPYHPGNMSFGFEQKAIFITMTGKMELHDVAVSGLSTVRRDGDCVRSSIEGTSKMSVNLAMGVLHFDSKARVSFMGYGITVSLNAKIGYVLLHLEAIGDDDATTPPSLETFKIYETKGEEATISGLGPLNYIANTITSVFIKLFKGTILSKAEEQLKVALDEMIKTSNFPLIDRL